MVDGIWSSTGKVKMALRNTICIRMGSLCNAANSSLMVML
nr:MAG TPA: hypothetical protein [Caudoviricetes sp.]